MHEVSELVRVAVPIASAGGIAAALRLVRTWEERRHKKAAGGVMDGTTASEPMRRESGTSGFLYPDGRDEAKAHVGPEIPGEGGAPWAI